MNAETKDISQVNGRAITYAVLLFVAGFVASAALLHWVVGDPLSLYGAERSEKLEILRRSGYAYTSAFFGTSHVHQGFDPRVFDAELAGSPIAVRSFNLGVDGGAMIEERAMALRFLDHLRTPPDDQPCFVMLEENADPAFSMIFTSHPRQINIFDPRSLQIVLQFPAEGYLRPNQIHHRLLNFESAFYHDINMGMLSNRIFRPPFNETSIAAEMVDDRRGLHYVPKTVYDDADLARAFSRERHPPTVISTQMVQGNALVMKDLDHARNGSRAQLVWVVMPELKDLMEYKTYPPSETMPFGDVPILDLARPDLYPELYNHALWLDSQHLNEKGSKLFSRLLAQQLLAWSKTHPPRKCGG
jgi:hypothetical protein